MRNEATKIIKNDKRDKRVIYLIPSPHLLFLVFLQSITISYCNDGR